MRKEEYLSLIDEVIAQGPYTDTWDSLCEHPVPKWYAYRLLPSHEGSDK